MSYSNLESLTVPNLDVTWLASDISPPYRELVMAAEDACWSSYPSSSGLRVGCAAWVKTMSGERRVVQGSNKELSRLEEEAIPAQENTKKHSRFYNDGIHAEGSMYNNALELLVKEGGIPAQGFLEAVAVCAALEDPIVPCGSCRDLLAAHASNASMPVLMANHVDASMPVLMANQKRWVRVGSIDALLPSGEMLLKAGKLSYRRSRRQLGGILDVTSRYFENAKAWLDDGPRFAASVVRLLSGRSTIGYGGTQSQAAFHGVPAVEGSLAAARSIILEEGGGFVERVFLVGKGDAIPMPFGRERQWLFETSKHQGRSLPVFLYSRGGHLLYRTDAESLLPLAFSM